MNRYRVEILGQVPNGLTQNDVYASVRSLIGECADIESGSQRRLPGGMVSVVVTFKTYSLHHAIQVSRRARTGVTGFSADMVGPRQL